MKSPVLWLSLLFLVLPGHLAGAETFKLETVLYVFRDADFAQVSVDGTPAAGSGQGQSFAAPTRVAFDGHVLELKEANYSWDGAGEKAPASFSQVGMPTVMVQAAQKASFYSAMPMQYMEKGPGGDLQVRQLESGAPGVPHYQFTVEVRREAGEVQLAVSCQLQLAVMTGREKIPGVELDVGRPVLAQFEDEFRLRAPSNAWTGLLLRKPSGGNYSLVLLVRVAAQPADIASSVDFSADGALDAFITHYYQRPRPEQVSILIDTLATHGLLDPGRQDMAASRRRARVHASAPQDPGRRRHPPAAPALSYWGFVGFFAELFAANPDRIEEWQRLGAKDWITRDCLRAAAKFSRPGELLAVKGPYILRPAAIFSLGNSWGSANEARWGGFLASGNPAYLRQFIDQLQEIDLVLGNPAALDAMLILAAYAPAHPLIRTSLEAARADASEKTRRYIDDLLTKNLREIQLEVAEIAPAGFPTDNRDNMYKGMRDSGYFGGVSPGQELRPKN